jgi:hypothetical protein
LVKPTTLKNPSNNGGETWLLVNGQANNTEKSMQW